MDIEARAPTLEELLGQAAWVRRLARSLTGDEASADDLTQDAYLAALERPPRERGNLRGWFARVLRNQARSSGRAEQRRTQRERSSARGEALPSSAELASDLEWQRRIASAVLELDDPYRSTVVLHYYRGLTLAEIARSQSEPAATVRSRLKRALDSLRAHLDQDHGGDRRAWSIALAAWARMETRLAAPAISGLLVAVLASTFVLTGVAGLLLWKSRTRSEPGSSAMSGAMTDTQAPARTESDRSSALVGSPEIRPRVAVVATATQASSEAPLIFGTVENPDRLPVAGARVTVFPNGSIPRPEPIARGITDGQGKFSLAAAPIDSTQLMIEADADGYSSSAMNPVVPGRDALIRLDWSVALTGTVRDALSRLPLAGTQVSKSGLRALSDNQGKYRLGGLLADSEHQIHVRLAGYADQSESIRVRGREDATFDFELAPGTPMEIEVFDQESGSPLNSVRVCDRFVSEPWVRTNAQGRFTVWVAPSHPIQLDLWLDEYWPTAWGWTPAFDETTTAPRIPMLRRAWVIGRIKDKEGTPVADVRVNPDGPRYRSRGVPDRELLKSWHTPGSVREGPLGFADVTASDSDGRYRLPVVAAEAPLVLRVIKEGFARAESDSIVVARSSEAAQMDFVLERAAKIHGIARFNGTNWRGRICLLAPDGTVATQTSADGKYSMKDVPAGNWTLQLDPLFGHTKEGLPHSTITVEAGQEYTLDFVWGTAPEMGTISGHVLSPAGEFPDLVSVDARPIDGKPEDRVSTRAAPDGTFALHVPKGIKYEVSAACRATRGFISGDARIETPDAEGVELNLPELGLLKLRLLEASNRNPVRLHSDSITNGLSWQRLDGRDVGIESFTVDVQGGVELQLVTGEYEIQLDLMSEGYLAIPPQKIKVTRAPPAAPETLEFERGLEASVCVFGPPAGDEGSLKGHILFLVERSQLPSISGPFAKGDPRINHNFGGGNGLHMRIEDPAIMNQFLAEEEFFAEGSIIRALKPGHYFIKCYPDDLIFEPAEFDILGPERAEIRIRWRTQR